MTITVDFVWYSNDVRRHLRSPPAIWTIPHAHNDPNIARDFPQTVWRRKWQYKYRLLMHPRQMQLLYHILRGADPVAAIQLVISSLTAQHERVKQQLASEREYCAHVAIRHCGRDVPDPAERGKVLCDLWAKTKSDVTGKEILNAWNTYYDTHNDLRAIEQELGMLGLSGCHGGTEAWNA
jgi:hypothetical protein